MNYIMRGIADLKYAIVIGILIYVIYFGFIHVLKKQKNISWKCIFELMFCVYSVLLLKLVGVFSLKLSLSGIKNYNIVPFIGSSIVPVILNFILFVPYGILLSIVFTSCKWNWKKICCVGAITSLIIELLQMFGGRYAEIDDLLMNTIGTLVGFLFYTFVLQIRENKKRALGSIAGLLIILTICFIGIYYLGDNKAEELDGFHAVANDISEVKLYYKGECKESQVDSEVYRIFATQISNCGGHLLDVCDLTSNEVLNGTDCFIEIIFANPQSIFFENADNFSMSQADRVMYNANENIIYWGNSGYQYYVDYTRFDEQFQEHQAVILEQYQELAERIIQCFE